MAQIREKEDILMRMQRELVEAMKKPLLDRAWIMAIDTRKCVGCSACTIACIAENKLPPGVVYRPVFDEEFGNYPNVTRRFTPRPCMQCANPPCVKVCPVNATWRRSDNIIEISYPKCIGCRYCITACPYNARTADFGSIYTKGLPTAEGLIVGQKNSSSYERLPSHEYGRAWVREHRDSPVGNARKCTFCLHRLQVGMLPECVTTCIGRATYFGDANDPNSLVVKVVVGSSMVRLKEELGTEPKVYYLL